MTGARTVFHTEWFDVEEESFPDVAALGGKPHYRITSPDGVLVLALTAEGEVILVRQYRPALREHTLELPSGAIEPRETPRDAAARELHEETGYRCARLVDVGHGRTMTNRHACRDFAFFGTDAVRDSGDGPKEAIETVLVTPRELRRLVLDGRFAQLGGLGVLLLVDWKLGRRL